MRCLGLALALAVVTAPAEASAEQTAAAGAKGDEPSGPGPALASVFPGVIAHGAGHFAGGDRKTAYRLLAIEGAGLGAAAVGLGSLAATGASRRFVGPSAALTIGGVGLFAISWLADIYGSSAPSAPSDRGEPLLSPPTITTELGYRYVYDPVFRYRSLVAEGVEGRVGALRLGAGAWFAVDDPNARVTALASYRLLGPGSGEPADDGSFVDLEAGGSYHAYRTEGFRLGTGELFAAGRLDLKRLSPSLRGSFASMGAGWAMQVAGYDGLSFFDKGDATEMLLFRFGFGAYLGGPGRAGSGEAEIYYDHRHDGYAAGLKATGLGSGVAGHFGLAGRYFVGPSWGASLDLQAGSAYVAGLSALYRQGGSP